MITPDSDSCSADGCEEPTPMDLPCIVFDRETWFCSPACAHVALDELETAPEVVALADPQFHVDRSALPAVADDQVGIEWAVDNSDGAHAAVARAGELHDAPFRFVPEPDGQ